MVNKYVVIDLETTGLSPERDKIIEIGAVKIENGILTGTYSKTGKPQCRNTRQDCRNYGNHIRYGKELSVYRRDFAGIYAIRW